MKIKTLVLTLLLLFSYSKFIFCEELWHTIKNPDEVVSSSEITKTKLNFVELSKKMNPTVVNVFTTQTIRYGGLQGSTGGQEDLFRLFEQMMNNRGGQFYSQPMERKATALGSGFIINSEGYVLTNNHVVNNADSIRVKLFNGKEYDAVLKGVDPDTDLALIQIINKGKTSFEYANLGDSSKAEVGEWVIAIGNPLGLSHTVTAGIISAQGKVIPEISIYNDYIQTDASINQGNSGGPLINTKGEVIGINTAIIRQAQGVAIEGIGFAIPINMAKKVLPKLAKGEKVAHQRGWLGIAMGDLTPDIARSLGIDENLEGVIIAEVVPNSPADKAGLKGYDIITSFDGKTVKTPSDLVVLIKRAEAGKKYQMDIVRKDRKLSKQIIIGIESPQILAENNISRGTSKNVSSYGLYVEDISKDSIRKNRLRGIRPHQGVLVVQVESGSSAANANIRVGDIILEINQARITNTTEFANALKKGVNLLKIKRGDHVIVVVIK